MAKESTTIKRYTIINAAIVGLVCGALGLFIEHLVYIETIKHDFAGFFSFAAVGIAITLLNFKPLSKLAIFLLPPVYALSAFSLVAGAIFMASRGWRKEDCSDFVILIVQNVPFFVIMSMLYNWYSSLAGKKSFIVYALFATTTVVVSMLIFGDKYPHWCIQGAYLGIGAFLLSLLHLKHPI